MSNCLHRNKRLILTATGPKKQCHNCGEILDDPGRRVNKTLAIDSKESILAKLRDKEADDLSDSELVRALGECTLAHALFDCARILRDENLIGENDLWKQETN